MWVEKQLINTTHLVNFYLPLNYYFGLHICINFLSILNLKFYRQKLIHIIKYIIINKLKKNLIHIEEELLFNSHCVCGIVLILMRSQNVYLLLWFIFFPAQLYLTLQLFFVYIFPFLSSLFYTCTLCDDHGE